MTVRYKMGWIGPASACDRYAEREISGHRGRDALRPVPTEHVDPEVTPRPEWCRQRRLERRPTHQYRVAPRLELVEAKRAGVPSVIGELHGQPLGCGDVPIEARAHAGEDLHAIS